MAPAVTCRACLAPNREDIEAVGTRALSGEISWREANRLTDFPQSVSLQNHMQKHYVDVIVAEAEDELDALIADGIAELKREMALAPGTIKPLYAAAIVNMRGLKNTNPSQQHLITALKTIQEMTGMRAEQRILMQFGAAMFKQAPLKVEAIPVPALPAGGGEENDRS